LTDYSFTTLRSDLKSPIATGSRPRFNRRCINNSRDSAKPFYQLLKKVDPLLLVVFRVWQADLHRQNVLGCQS